MAKTNEPKTAAPETAQEETQAQETASECAQEVVQAAQGEQPSAAQETSFGGAERPFRQPAAAQDLAELSEGLMTGYAVTGCDALNLREGPSLDARVIAVIPRDAGVFAEEGPENGWLRVCTGWLAGHMMAEYLKPLPWPVLPHGTE